MGFFDFLGGLLNPKKAEYQFKCPSCGYGPLSSADDICPQCGLRVKSVMRVKCRKCGSLNELDAEKCWKCGYVLASSSPDFGYRCPVCGFENGKFFSVCPTCGTRVV